MTSFFEKLPSSSQIASMNEIHTQCIYAYSQPPLLELNRAFTDTFELL